MTNDLVRRVFEHREGHADGFTKRYGIKRLVHYETYDDVLTAIQREKTMKHWKRAWKVDLIEAHNPTWTDLRSRVKPAGDRREGRPNKRIQLPPSICDCPGR